VADLDPVDLLESAAESEPAVEREPAVEPEPAAEPAQDPVALPEPVADPELELVEEPGPVVEPEPAAELEPVVPDPVAPAPAARRSLAPALPSRPRSQARPTHRQWAGAGKNRHDRRHGAELHHQCVETMTSEATSRGNQRLYGRTLHGSLSADPSKNSGAVAEVAMTTTWDGSSGKIPFDIEVRFAMARCAPGLYGYVVLTHPASYPAFTPGELRVNHYVQWDSVFDYYAVDDNRRGCSHQWRPRRLPRRSRCAPGSAEIPVGALCRSARLAEVRPHPRVGRSTVYGWSSSKKNIGLWLIIPRMNTCRVVR